MKFYSMDKDATMKIEASNRLDASTSFSFKIVMEENGRQGHATFTVQAKNQILAWAKLIKEQKDLMAYAVRIELLK